MHKRYLTLFVFFAGIMPFIRCAPIGGGTEDVNTLVATGMVFDKNNNPAPGAVVLLVPSDYNPVLSDSSRIRKDVTGSNGSYSFRVSESGSFSIQVFLSSDKTRALIANEAVSGDTTIFPPANLSLPGSIKISFPDNLPGSDGYVYVPGTTIFAPVTTAGHFTQLDSVPAGILPSLNHVSSGSVKSILRLAVPVVPAEVTTVDLPGWKYAARLVLNTSGSGANVGTTVCNFPVLVRLTDDNFTFIQTMENGDDLRFTKNNGQPLFHEIERWDAPNGYAAVWVKVDTVFGNNDSQWIMMYWGNAGVAGNSNSAMVFDTAAGFIGVWHLGETGSIVYNAAADTFAGMATGTVPVEGIAGNARNFTPGDYIKISGLLNAPANLTLSAWVRSDTSGRAGEGYLGQELISIGDYALIRMDNTFGIGTCGWFHNSPIVDTSHSSTRSGQFLANSGWHLITYTIDATLQVQALFIDGVKVALTNDVNQISYIGLGNDTYIGIHGNGETVYNFSGQIDEVRVYRTAQPEDHVKLSFMNQKQDDELVMLRPSF